MYVLRDSFTRKMTDNDFLKFCLENSDLRIERNSDLEVILAPLPSTLFSFYTGELFAQLYNWNKATNEGVVFDSSTGFTLPDRSVLSPDASWLSKEKWFRLSKEDQNRFAPVCPEFIIEVRSKSDSLEELKKKMNVWIANGCDLAWLIDPENEMTYLYRPGGSVRQVKGFKTVVKGDGPVQGFELDLSLLKNLMPFQQNDFTIE